MKTYEGPESYSRYGFSITRNVLSKDQVLETRALLDSLFKRGDYVNQRSFFWEELFRHPLLYCPMFSKSVVESLKKIFGKELAYLPNFQIHHNWYGIPGWHTDCASEASNAYLYRQDYRFAKCGIFFQDYDNGWGGSIYVKPGSHLEFMEKNAVKRARLKFLNRMRTRLHFGTVTAPVRAGDMLVFDSRILHQSSEPARENRKTFKWIAPGLWRVPEAHTKYVLYWDACPRFLAQSHIDHCVKKAYEDGPDYRREVGKEVVYSRNIALCYPDDYPQEFVECAENLGITMTTLDKASCERFKERFKALTLAEARSAAA